MDKKYAHQIVEKNKFQNWQDHKFFQSQNSENKPNFTIILPPPNITGKLHLGHALNGYIQDTLIRYFKLKNFNVLWLPATDHAGISAQSRVVKELAKENIFINQLDKNTFLKKINKWKEIQQEKIKEQWTKLGFALDFSRLRYTADAKMSDLVQKTFIKMYQDQLIYRGPRAIYWDVAQQTALSNIEIKYETKQSEMYYIKYQIADDIKNYITIATTRPETIFSDVAIVLNPQDPRFKKLQNQKILNPLNGRVLKVISDAYVEPHFGTGIMKCSAHAEEDIRIMLKHKLKIIECIDKQGLMNANAGDLQGKKRFQARKDVVDKLQKENKIVKIETIQNNIGYSERSHTVIEILFSTQWFVKMKKLAQLVLKHLDSEDQITFLPFRFKKVLQKWMLNVHDWTISRQIWWGHSIPAWYKNDELKVQVDSPGKDWQADSDVLDTWFSSALAPFGFLDETEVADHFPSDVLVTAYDIIFFWVARMYFQSLYIKNQKPFKEVIFNGIVRDSQGRKMSKSLGNGIDPLEVIKKHGSDALRWFLLTKGTLGQDLSYSSKDVEHGWNIANKLWNLARFILTTEIKSANAADSKENELDQWIKVKFNFLLICFQKAMKSYNFTVLGQAIQKFIFNDFASNYVEMNKALGRDSSQIRNIFEKLLIVLQPLLPFLSDDLYFRFKKNSVLNQQWPKHFVVKNPKKIEKYDELSQIISEIRNLKQQLNLTSKEILFFYWKFANQETVIAKIIENVLHVKFQEKKTNQTWIKITTSHFFTIEMLVNQKMQQSQINRLEKRQKLLFNEVKRSKNILSNITFLERAPKTKVLLEKEKLINYQNQLNEIQLEIKKWNKN